LDTGGEIYIKVASKFFEYVAKLRYFVARITNQNCSMKRLRAFEKRMYVTWNLSSSHLL
jgi:hypothetical protein